MGTTIRTATVADVPQILAFIRALATYERAPDAVTATEEGLRRDGFGPNPFYYCHIAEQNGLPVGFALYFFNYSTWKGQPGVYLEDLFVQPEYRGLGLGKALLKRVAAFALERGCQRLQWEVLDWNARPSTSIAQWEQSSLMNGEMFASQENRCVAWQALK